MLTNQFVDAKMLELKQRKADLVKRKAELVNIMDSLGISRIAAKKASAGLIDIDERSLMLRENIVKEMAEIEKGFAQIKVEKAELSNRENAVKNKALIEVFSEIFTKEQMVEIKKEAVRRMGGESGFKLSFSVKESIEEKEKLEQFKAIAIDQLNKWQEVRIILTKVIEAGCQEFGHAEFMKVISPLNRLVIPVSEVNKIRNKITTRILHPSEKYSSEVIKSI